MRFLITSQKGIQSSFEWSCVKGLYDLHLVFYSGSSLSDGKVEQACSSVCRSGKHWSQCAHRTRFPKAETAHHNDVITSFVMHCWDEYYASSNTVAFVFLQKACMVIIEHVWTPNLCMFSKQKKERGTDPDWEISSNLKFSIYMFPTAQYRPGLRARANSSS